MQASAMKINSLQQNRASRTSNLPKSKILLSVIKKILVQLQLARTVENLQGLVVKLKTPIKMVKIILNKK